MTLPEKVESLDDGYTNEVYRTEDDTVVKCYQGLSASVVVHSFRELLLGQEMCLAEDRISNEKEVRAALGDSIEYAEIIGEYGKCLEMDYVEGDILRDYIERDPSEARQMGKNVGKLISIFRQKDLYLSDWALDDILVTEDGLVMMDFEFGGRSQSSFRKSFDIASVFSRAAGLDGKVYRQFMEGLESEVEIKSWERVLGLSVSFWFNLFYAWDDGKPVKVLKNALRI